MRTLFLALIVLICCSACHSPNGAAQKPVAQKHPVLKQIAVKDTSYKIIHVLVALCDNKYQGIIPVPPKIGNGQDKELNLYWGCDNGVRTYFKKSKEWTLLKKSRVNDTILERLVFKHATKPFYLVADAYDGKYILRTTVDLLHSCSGQLKDTVRYQNKTIGINGNASLLAYIGHDGLMDFGLGPRYQNTDGKTRQCIILACISKKYFGNFITQTKANPLVWTTGLMCPEAYTLHDALTGYVNNESAAQIQQRAAKAYAKYQKCSLKAASALLVSGQ